MRKDATALLWCWVYARMRRKNGSNGNLFFVPLGNKNVCAGKARFLAIRHLKFCCRMGHFSILDQGAVANRMPVGDPLRDRMLSWQELQDASDQEVARQLYLGNNDALAVIVDRYQQLVFAVALRIVKDRSEAEDVVQTVFLDIFRKVEQFDAARGTLKVWLLQYAYSRAINRRHYLEDRRFYSQVEIDELELGRSEPTGVARLWSGESSRLVNQGLQLLNIKQQRAIELVYFEGLTPEEAAEQTGETPSALRHQYYRGLMKLREFLNVEKTQRQPRTTDGPAIRLEVAGADPRPI